MSESEERPERPKIEIIERTDGGKNVVLNFSSGEADIWYGPGPNLDFEQFLITIIKSLVK